MALDELTNHEIASIISPNYEYQVQVIGSVIYPSYHLTCLYIYKFIDNPLFLYHAPTPISDFFLTTSSVQKFLLCIWNLI